MGCTTEDIKRLSDEFPREDIHWRAQSVTKNGDKAMALAYLDARNVMNRLDDVVGPENWQDEYDCVNGRTICKLGINVDGVWVWKSDGAGDTQVEAEKGGISDAFKRAAVKWGIGRYLYNMPTIWVPCETYEDRNGRKQWRRWKQNPWDLVPGGGTPKQEAKRVSAAEMKRGLKAIDDDLIDCQTIGAVTKCGEAWKHIFDRDGWTRDYVDVARDRFAARIQEIKSAEAEDVFPGDTPVNGTSNPHQHPIMAG